MFGFLGAAYFGWAQHGADLKTVVGDRQWPRAWPYPDPWIAEWNQILEVRNPAADPDTIKLHGEFAAVRAALLCFFLGFLLIGGAGLRTLVIARTIENSAPHSEPTDPNGVSTVE